MISSRMLAGVGGIAALAGVLAGWTVRDWKADADQLAESRRIEAIREKDRARQDEKAEQLEQQLATMRSSDITDRNTIREVYREVEVPSECIPPAAAVSLLNDAVSRANAATGEPASAVRSAAEAP